MDLFAVFLTAASSSMANANKCSWIELETVKESLHEFYKVCLCRLTTEKTAALLPLLGVTAD